MTIYTHIHHIIPRHMGGSDDPNNLVELTIEEHAEAHRLLYEEHGIEYDRIAWLSLSNSISKQEAMRLAQSEGAKRGIRMYPEKHSAGGKALWAKPGMREHLSTIRKLQSASGNNPMQGKTQKRVVCITCRKEMGSNGLKLHAQKCR